MTRLDGAQPQAQRPTISDVRDGMAPSVRSVWKQLENLIKTRRAQAREARRGSA